MIICFELSMPNRASWNGKWSGGKDIHVITKTDRDSGVSRKRIEELAGKSFYYNFGDGWTACVSTRIIDAREARRLKKANRGFCGYDWMVRSIILRDCIERATT